MTTIALSIGVKLPDNRVVNECTLVRGNGVTEKVLLNKSGASQYEWVARCLCASIASLGGYDIATPWREAYLKENNTPIHPIVLQIPLAQADYLMLQVHKYLWKDTLEDEPAICMHCGKDYLTTIHLDRFDYSEKAKRILTSGQDFFTLEVTLKDGFAIPESNRDNELFGPLQGKVVTQVAFRVPTLHDAIEAAKLAEDEVSFWRHVAYGCLTGLSIIEEGGIATPVPSSLKGAIGYDRLFNLLLTTKDLKLIRNVLRDGLPVIDLTHTDVCPHCNKVGEVMMPVKSFFAD